jgi:hypothetical protein
MQWIAPGPGPKVGVASFRLTPSHDFPGLKVKQLDQIMANHGTSSFLPLNLEL